jgi:hypothetical protein
LRIISIITVIFRQSIEEIILCRELSGRKCRGRREIDSKDVRRNDAVSSESCSKVDQWETFNILGKLEQERTKGSCCWKLNETRRDQAIVLLLK